MIVIQVYPVWCTLTGRVLYLCIFRRKTNLTVPRASMKCHKFLVVAVIVLTFVLGGIFQRRLLKLFTFRHFNVQDNSMGIEIKVTAGTQNPADGSKLGETDGRIARIIHKIDQLIPNVTFTHADNATCAKNIKVTILSAKEKFCIGDQLTLRLAMYDYLGKRKTHGGDFLRPRIYTPALGAAASGRVEDLKNGTYLVHFRLFWEGRVQVSLLLIHPSELVQGLWRARNSGFGNIKFIGTFGNATHETQTECNFALKEVEGMCLHLGKMGEWFYCKKPEQFPCETLTRMQSFNRQNSYLNDLEQHLSQRSNVGVEIPKPFEFIDVIHSNKTEIEASNNTCKIGMHSPFPSGYFLKNIWNPIFCKMLTFRNSDEKRTCLAGKMIYFFGDSTLRQWILHCSEAIHSLRYFDLHRTGLDTQRLALDMEKNTLVQWKSHGYPYIASNHYLVKDVEYISQQIDNLSGGKHTAIVINVGQHFRPFPIEVFIRRVLDIRGAVERLFLRSPDTKVIVKAENTRELTIDQERFSDFHGYIQYLVVNEIFHGLNVGMVDAWDMTAALATNNVHPPEVVVRSQVEMFLTYIY